MKKIKISEAQARMLKEMGDEAPKNKLLKVTESQYQKILALESMSLQTEDELVGIDMPPNKVPSKSVTKNFEKGLDKNVGKEIGKLYEDFLNELYGINEDGGKNSYQSLIKLMEVAGLIQNGKIKKEKFNSDKNRVKEVMTHGLYEMSQGASHYKVMETIENALNENYLNPELDQYEEELETQLNSILGADVASVSLGIYQATGLGFGKARIKIKKDIDSVVFSKLIQAVESNGYKVDPTQTSNDFELDPGERYYYPKISFSFDPRNGEEQLDEITAAGGGPSTTSNAGPYDANALGTGNFMTQGNKLNKKMNKDGSVGNVGKIPVVSENSNQRYVGELDFYIWANSDEEAKSQANQISEIINNQFDNSAKITKLYKQPQGTMTSSPVNENDDRETRQRYTILMSMYKNASGNERENLKSKLLSAAEKLGITLDLTENSHKDTQYPGGGFVEIDDCTKLNNNKVAQNGGCSQGAIDNVVKTKGSTKSVVAKENVYETIAKKTGKTIDEVKAIISKSK